MPTSENPRISSIAIRIPSHSDLQTFGREDLLPGDCHSLSLIKASIVVSVGLPTLVPPSKYEHFVPAPVEVTITVM
jgi:hypothetical protein